MKALVILDCEDCTYDEIEEFGVEEIQLSKKGGGCFLWNNGFKIVPMPQKRILPKEIVEGTNYGEEPWFSDGYNACIDEILEIKE